VLGHHPTLHPPLHIGEGQPDLGAAASQPRRQRIVQHAEADEPVVQDKWPESVPTRRALAEARTDTVASVTFDGIMTMAVMATTAAAFFGTQTTIDGAGAMAEQLERLLGPAARIFFAVGCRRRA
jgi:Mn2+/Fe2+ NRAMP family transporter